MRQTAEENMLPVIIGIDDYAMVGTHEKRLHIWQSSWRGPMRLTQAGLYFLFKMENKNDGKKSVTHPQRLLPQPATRRGKQIAAKLKRHSERYDTEDYVVESIRRIGEEGDWHKVLLKWIEFEDDNTIFGNRLMRQWRACLA